MIRKVGIITTWNGTIRVARMRTNTTSRPKKRSRAKA